LYLFALHSLYGVGMKHVIYAVHKDADVGLLSVMYALLAVGSSTLPE
jgi:hypothetical protein